MSRAPSSLKEAPNPWWVAVISGMASYIDAAAILALITPLLLSAPLVMYGILAVLVAVGVLVGWLAFHRAVFNAFTIEGKDLADAQEALFAAGIRPDAPGAAARLDRR